VASAVAKRGLPVARAVTLFTPITIRGLELPNRIVKSAMAEGHCDEFGRPAPGLARLYERWSEGGVGLAITGMAHVLPGYSYTGREIGLHDEASIEPLRAVTAAAHRHAGKIFAQLCHAPPQLPRSRARRLGAVAPSAGFNKTNLLFDRQIPGSELERLARAFGQAARRAREAEFDGVQLHAAHGYLLSRMLSPRHNRRRDGWGGDFERRLRFPLECVRAVRSAVGSDFPIAVKLNLHDGERHGLEPEQGIEIAHRLEAAGVDAIEVSAGTGDVGLGFYPNKGGVPIASGREFLRRELPLLRPLLPLSRPVIERLTRRAAFEHEAYFLPLAERVAAAVSIPVICVGGVRSRSVAERILATSRVQMVSLARPLVREPSLPRRWQRGDADQASCESCNECFVRIGLGEPLRCHRRGSGGAKERT
jgi:2,4-dienoyl-CoA reductase-like NADH-dependent reductase (Old Yellow Enzyme family)